MWRQPESEPFGEETYLAGERVLPGMYRQVDGPREILLAHEDFLPASLDGRVACYRRVQYVWAEMERRKAA